MTRLVIALAVWMTVAPLLSASLAPRKQPSVLGTDIPSQRASTPVVAAAEQAAAPSNSEYVLTEETEILLNGKTCKYENVPSHASIQRMEVAADRKTVLRVYFRAR